MFAERLSGGTAQRVVQAWRLDGNASDVLSSLGQRAPQTRTGSGNAFRYGNPDLLGVQADISGHLQELLPQTADAPAGAGATLLNAAQCMQQLIGIGRQQQDRELRSNLVYGTG